MFFTIAIKGEEVKYNVWSLTPTTDEPEMYHGFYSIREITGGHEKELAYGNVFDDFVEIASDEFENAILELKDMWIPEELLSDEEE